MSSTRLTVDDATDGLQRSRVLSRHSSFRSKFILLKLFSDSCYYAINNAAHINILHYICIIGFT